MSSRQYSSFLLRFWLINDTSAGTTSDDASPLVLQLQHLQTGTTWRLNSLEELNTLLGKAIDKSEMLLSGGSLGGKSLSHVTRMDNEVE